MIKLHYNLKQQLLQSDEIRYEIYTYNKTVNDSDLYIQFFYIKYKQPRYYIFWKQSDRQKSQIIGNKLTK